MVALAYESWCEAYSDHPAFDAMREAFAAGLKSAVAHLLCTAAVIESVNENDPALPVLAGLEKSILDQAHKIEKAEDE
jgi:hypothetical protein